MTVLTGATRRLPAPRRLGIGAAIEVSVRSYWICERGQKCTDISKHAGGRYM